MMDAYAQCQVLRFREKPKPNSRSLTASAA
ncbi:MAG: hypothetical protein ACXVCH_15085 [Bdellovibrionota bacterium]